MNQFHGLTVRKTQIMPMVDATMMRVDVIRSQAGVCGWSSVLLSFVTSTPHEGPEKDAASQCRGEAAFLEIANQTIF